MKPLFGRKLEMDLCLTKNCSWLLFEWKMMKIDVFGFSYIACVCVFKDNELLV